MAVDTDPQRSVLEMPPPRFTPREVEAITAELFGVTGKATNLGSERDQTFLVDGDGSSVVVKISNVGEAAAVLDLESEAILHIARTNPSLPVAQPQPIAGADGNRYRTTVAGPDGTHFVRVFERLCGRNARGAELDDGALFAYGKMHAQLNLALRSFFHPAAGRELLWDLKNTVQLMGTPGLGAELEIAANPDFKDHRDSLAQLASFRPLPPLPGQNSDAWLSCGEALGLATLVLLSPEAGLQL